MPGTGCDGTRVAVAVGLVPGLQRLRQHAAAAAVADQLFFLRLQLLEHAAQVQLPGAGEQAFAGLAAAAQQVLAALAQAHAVEAEAALEQVAAGAAEKSFQRVVRHRLVGGVTQRVAGALAADEGGLRAVA